MFKSRKIQKGFDILFIITLGIMFLVSLATSVIAAHYLGDESKKEYGYEKITLYSSIVNYFVVVCSTGFYGLLLILMYHRTKITAAFRWRVQLLIVMVVVVFLAFFCRLIWGVTYATNSNKLQNAFDRATIQCFTTEADCDIYFWEFFCFRFVLETIPCITLLITFYFASPSSSSFSASTSSSSSSRSSSSSSSSHSSAKDSLLPREGGSGGGRAQYATFTGTFLQHPQQSHSQQYSHSAASQSSASNAPASSFSINSAYSADSDPSEQGASLHHPGSGVDVSSGNSSTNIVKKKKKKKRIIVDHAASAAGSTSGGLPATSVAMQTITTATPTASKSIAPLSFDSNSASANATAPSSLAADDLSAVSNVDSAAVSSQPATPPPQPVVKKKKKKLVKKKKQIIVTIPYDEGRNTANANLHEPVI
eukprot:MONOS_3437.1-p1 / transcript=MONOS_3437.1 / gene=MONOS_3437 / organism=Monocercomonoides_exilis_PA203 / gene_product=unspecified product / transcript_product=unspecified product / location=Mono_scaffold00081:45834-47272(-) / protein_length=423 / sequence_SO=supercontig / SO=protein_coding / is_pseudo=false